VIIILYLMAGAFVGFFIAALMCAAGREDEWVERLEAQRTRPEDLELEEFTREEPTAHETK